MGLLGTMRTIWGWVYLAQTIWGQDYSALYELYWVGEHPFIFLNVRLK